MLRIFDADGEQHFKGHVGIGAHERDESAAVETSLLKVVVHPIARAVGPRIATRSVGPSDRRRCALPLGVIRQVLAAFFPPACVGLFDPLADFRVELAALSKFETKCGNFVRQVRRRPQRGFVCRVIMTAAVVVAFLIERLNLAGDGDGKLGRLPA